MRSLNWIVAALLFVAVLLVSRIRHRGTQPAGVPVITGSGDGGSREHEEAVIVKIPLSDKHRGTLEERQELSGLEDHLSTVVRKSRAGEYDGNEFGGGAFTLYFYGPSADELTNLILPTLKTFKAPSGSFFVKRYGKPGAKEVRISLTD
jgi:hypothetical protein